MTDTAGTRISPAIMQKAPALIGDCKSAGNCGLKKILAKDVIFRAGCTLMREEYRVMWENGLPGRLLGGGARGLHHFTEFVGGACDITINWTGTADKLLEADAPVISRMDTPTPDYVLDELTAKVPTFAKAYAMDGLNADEYSEFPPVKLFRSQFEAGWDQLLKEVRNA